MPNPTRPLSAYHPRLQRVSDYIHDHLDEPLNMTQLAEIGCLSPGHWHRIYASFFGETMAATIKRLRLQRAAGYLAQRTMAVAQVAKQCGYPNVQSFTRTFSDTYGLPPAQYRQKGQHAQFHFAPPVHQAGRFEVSLRTVAPLQVAGVAHRGSYMNISKAFTRLYSGFAAQGVDVSNTRCIGVYLDDPFAAPEASLRSLACLTVTPEESVLPGLPPLEQRVLRGGRHAVLRYQGPYASMHAAYEWFFGYWLLQSGAQAADEPVYEDYLNNPVDTPPNELLTDIYMPLAE